MIRTLKFLVVNCNEACETYVPLLHPCGFLLVFGEGEFSSLETVIMEKDSLEMEQEVMMGYHLNLRSNGRKEIINREM